MGRYRTFKYLLLPNKIQAEKINRVIDACAFLSNKYRTDLKSNVSLPNNPKQLLEHYVAKYDFLLHCDASALYNVLFFINDEKHRKNHEPKNSFKINYTNYIRTNYPILDEKVYVHNIGWIKKKNNRSISNAFVIKSFMITKQANNKYYILITTQIDESYVQKVNLDMTKIIGLDYSSTHFAVDNFGNKYDLVKQYTVNEKKIIDYQKRLSKCKKGSNQYNEIKRLIKKTYDHIFNSRLDALHKLSTKLVNDYDYIVVEDLDMIEMVKNYNLAKATLDNCFSKFILMLDYKAKDKNKKLIKVNKWFPSSKICSRCGCRNYDLKLSDKQWTCPLCGESHDRDINAAINIRNEGMRIIKSVGQTECDMHRAIN